MREPAWLRALCQNGIVFSFVKHFNENRAEEPTITKDCKL